MAETTSSFSHWNKHARQWQHVKAPLRPCAEDLALIVEALARHFPDRATLNGLLLGVTPELAENRWAHVLRLVAVDNTLAMIQGVWPKDDEHRHAICGDWLQLPLNDASMDVALIDGGLPAMSFPDAYRQLATQLHRVLKPGGLFVTRIFARPENAETVGNVLAALQSRQIGNFHILKWRLAMALQGDDASTGVRLDDIWRYIDKHCGQHAGLAQMTGWPIEEIGTIDAYRGSSAIYQFPSVGELVGAFGAKLDCVEEKRCTYELAERFPTLVFRKTAAP